jgi:uncharacterized membrane protein YdjX (TVP38/TMEM64 family)
LGNRPRQESSARQPTPTPREQEAARNVESGAPSSGPLAFIGRYWKLATFLVVAGVMGAGFWFYRDSLSLERLAEHEQAIRAYRNEHPVGIYLAALVLYAAVTGFSLPGATLMTLIYAWFFGFARGLILVSFASTLGATIAFLLSRFFFRNAIQTRFGHRLLGFNRALQREGAFYLFTLRLIPAVPFFVINVVMGLTPLSVGTYWWVSQVGMLPGTAVYCYAGSSMPDLQRILDPAQLGPDDIADWDQLRTMLLDEPGTAQSSGDASGAVAEIRERIDPRTLEHWAAVQGSDQRGANQRGSEHLAAARRAVIAQLNDLLAESDLYQSDTWSDVPLNESTQRLLDKSQRAPLKPSAQSRLNRALLEAALSPAIRPEEPILSPRLILAFVLLGIFPLAAKKTMQWVRPASGVVSDTPEDGHTSAGQPGE